MYSTHRYIGTSVHRYLNAVVWLSLFFTNSTFAQTIQLLPPLSSAVNILSTTINPTTSQPYNLGIAGYNPSGNIPACSIAQWGRSSPLYPGSGASSGWLNANGTASIQYYPSANVYNNVYQLTQGGNTCNNEFDLFLQPTNPITPSNPLTGLGSLFLDIGINQVYTGGTNGISSNCTYNYSQYTFSLIFQTTSTPIQTLFYQINIGSTDPSTSVLNSPPPGNDFDFNRNVAWCPEYEVNNSGLTSNAFCLDDDIRNFGGLFSNQYTNTLNNIDLLSRFIQIISKTPYHTKALHPSVQLNPDASKWRVVGVYYGNITQGGSIGAAQWYGQSLKSTAGGSFCSNSKRIQWSCSAPPPGQGWSNVGGGCYHKNSNVSC